MSTKYSGNNTPTWLNFGKVVDAAKNTISKITSSGLNKTAASNLVTISYRDSKGHVVQATDPAIVSQLAKGGALVDTWGGKLVPHKQIKVYVKSENMHVQSEAKETLLDTRERQIHPTYMVDSTINRHMQYKALQALADFAGECGMWGARAKYLIGKNAAMEGKHFQGYREVTAELSWLIGPRLRKNVVATVGIDLGGKFVLPKIFKTADGVEHPFTKEAVAELLKGMEFEKPSREVRKRSDTPVFKKPDCTRFQAIPK